MMAVVVVKHQFLFNIFVTMTLLSSILDIPTKTTTVHAFQPPSALFSAFKLKQVTSRGVPSFSIPCSTTSLNVKFKIDNEEDDDTSTLFSDNFDNNLKQQQQQQQQEEQFSYQQTQLQQAPSTTFGAEAVPEAQRPANEYMELLASPLFGWANRENNPDQALLTRLLALYVPLFAFICWPISGATFTTDGYGLHKFFSSNVGAIGFILVILLRLYTGWGYVGSRLQSKEIEYEETGW